MVSMQMKSLLSLIYNELETIVANNGQAHNPTLVARLEWCRKLKGVLVDVDRAAIETLACRYLKWNLFSNYTDFHWMYPESNSTIICALPLHCQ